MVSGDAFVPHLISNKFAMSIASSVCLHAVKCRDRPESQALRAATRPAHLEWAERSGVVVFGGPLLHQSVANDNPVGVSGKPCGSLFIMDGDEARLREILDSDPYKLAGLFEDVELRRWTRGMVNRGSQNDQRDSSDNRDASRRMFCVWCVDKDGMRDLRKATRPRHLEWWTASNRRGVIGPFPAADGDGAVGTMIICEGSSIDDIKRWASTDPYAASGLFERVDVVELQTTMGSVFD